MSAPTSYAPGARPPVARVAYAALPSRPAPQAAALAGATMGTTWSARLALPEGCAEGSARQAIQAALDEVVAEMSTWEDHSDITGYNRAGPGWHALPAGFWHVLTHALALAEESGGAYDPTVGPLVNAWGFGPHQRAFEPPSPAAVEAARARCGWRRVKLDPERRAAWQEGGTYLDLSSIAKGHGVDRAAQALDAGRDRLSGGSRRRAARARPAARRPALARGRGSARRQRRPRAGAAAARPEHRHPGDYRRHAGSGDARYAHTIDPRDGQPVRNGVASVTVLHADCMQADALATALTVLGETEGLDLARRHGLAALFILREAGGFRLAATPAFQALAAQS